MTQTITLSDLWSSLHDTDDHVIRLVAPLTVISDITILLYITYIQSL